MKVVFFFAMVMFVVGVGVWALMIRMPGTSRSGQSAMLTSQEAARGDEVRRHVEKLAGEIGERNLVQYDALLAASRYVDDTLASNGYLVERQEVHVTTPSGVRTTDNLAAEIRGSSRPHEIVVIGAHYDSALGTPGADDNATGTAAVLCLARAFAGKRPTRTVRFVLFTNEEPPYYHTASMGSLVYARGAKSRGESIVAMLSLETIGYFSEQPNSQRYPFPTNLLYPSTGNFLGFVGNVASRDLVRRAIGSFRAQTAVPSEGVAAPAFITGIDWSDQWSFWEQGYPGIMLTDTALYRNPNYHARTDTPDTIDYERLARVVKGLESVVADLAGMESSR